MIRYLQSQLSPIDEFFNLLPIFIFLEMSLREMTKIIGTGLTFVPASICPPSFTYLVLRTASNILTNITGWTTISDYDVAFVCMKNVRLHTHLIDCLVGISLCSI